MEEKLTRSYIRWPLLKFFPSLNILGVHGMMRTFLSPRNKVLDHNANERKW